jgi:hypothetical protein
MVSLTPKIYEQLQLLAEKNDRPLNWELRSIVLKALVAAGLWPPPSPSSPEE